MKSLLSLGWWNHSVTSLLAFAHRFRLFCCLGLACLLNVRVQAQCPGATVPSNFANWNWEEIPYDPANPGAGLRSAYCNTWQANVITGSQVSPVAMGAPWVSPGSSALQAIALRQDYKKADGWELIRFDFGARGNVSVPYFILYHKYTGVMRVYAYIVNTNPFKGVTFTLYHSENNQGFTNRNAATRGLARTFIQAPDKYLSQPSSSSSAAEQTTYAAFFAGNGHWTMGQFTMLLDPNINNPSYNLNSYQLQINGMISSSVMLKGAFQFKTDRSEDSDFSFSGPNSAPKSTSPNSPIQEIAATGQKFLGDLSSIATKVQDINKKANATVNSIDEIAKKLPSQKVSGPLLDIQRASKGIAKLSDSNVLKTVGQVADQLGGVFSLAGSVIGLFTDDASTKPAFVPTVSKGTITMDGTITTQTMLNPFFIMTPATSHNTPGTNNPAPNVATQLSYYNCPLGIFNIRVTPVLQKIDYLRYMSYYQSLTDPNISERAPYTREATQYSSYALMTDIKPIVNAASGLEIKSVKIAIAQRVPLKSLAEPFVDDYYIDYLNAHRTYNFLYSQVSSGMLEAYPYDPGTAGDGSDAQVIVQTPFIDAGCVGSVTPMPFNIPKPGSNNQVYLRLIAELHKIGTPADSAPVYFSQDYDVDIVNSAATPPSSPLYLSDLSPFQPYLATPYSLPHPYVYDVTKTGVLAYNSNKGSEIANRSLLFDQGANVTVTGNAGGNVPVAFHASQSIGITGTLSVDYGSDLAITTDFPSIGPNGWYRCSSSPTYESTNLPCAYDNSALRTTATLAAATASEPDLGKLNLFPNPAATSTTIQLKVADAECIEQADLLNVEGKVVWHKSFACSHKVATDIALSGLPTGIYIVRVTSSVRTYVSKLSVE